MESIKKIFIVKLTNGEEFACLEKDPLQWREAIISFVRPVRFYNDEMTFLKGKPHLINIPISSILYDYSTADITLVTRYTKTHLERIKDE